MSKLAAFRVVLVLFSIATIIIIFRHFQSADLPDPSRQSARAGGCVISEEAAKTHNGEKGYENAWIQFVNSDNTVQVQMVDTKLILLFKTRPNYIACYRKGWIVPATIESCVENSDGECDFKLPHTVYVRAEQVGILDWKYPESAHPALLAYYKSLARCWRFYFYQHPFALRRLNQRVEPERLKCYDNFTTCLQKT
jgi:hypothetical protein